MRRRRNVPGRVVACCGLVGVALTGCTGGAPDRSPDTVSIKAAPQTALYDVPVSVTVSGLGSGADVTVSSSVTDASGVPWSAHAAFRAADDGTVSLDRAPTSGSYSGADPMGLFTAMTPGRATDETFPAPGTTGQSVHLRVTVGGKQVAATTVQRQSAAAVGVRSRRLEVASTGVRGTMFLPSDTTRRRPAVLAFGGSEGGESMDFSASMLAAHGYPALSLAYFAAPGVPANLENIPLEYFARALRLLATQPGVDPSHVLVWGVSRGGEAAMLLGVHYPRLVSAVIATSTSDHVNSGLPDHSVSAWTLAGRPLPFGGPGDFSTPGAPSAPGSVIPVEQIKGPVFTVCGSEDLLIPSCPFAAAIAARRGAQGRRLGDVHLAYPKAGHPVGGMAPYYSTTATTGRTASGTVVQLGGAIPDNAEAAGAARQRFLTFLAALD